MMETSETATITPEKLYELWRNGRGADLIDVRTPAEYREVHAQNARSVPLDSLDPTQVMSARNGSADEPLYIICHTGSRARQACDRFARDGFTNVACVEGGTAAWEQAGLPVVRGRKTMSLDRQVRIVAGSLVLLGVGLGFWVHTLFFGLAALVGAGLVVAGVTDTCVMARWLATMPWNRAGTSQESCAC